MRQIKSTIQVIAKIFFKKDIITYEIENNATSTEVDLLHKKLLELLSSLKINEAENLLFECIRTHDLNYLKLSVDFYNRLNNLSDEQLMQSNFSS